jgi:hypothetical protein
MKARLGWRNGRTGVMERFKGKEVGEGRGR